ncbi:phage tail tape measure protein [uncultured Alsobacter sp.]|uniref:phage tail tape measure protein n=1 Tax=uncultured Alsobacter sp. TaxID=1748258 RepID=UPI0025E49C1E|nr:phage tail tape measure protein [uncultured Alsobacter sp.]
MDPTAQFTDTLQAAGRDMERLTAMAEKLSASLAGAFATGIARGKSFDDVLKGVAQRLEQTALKASLQPLQQLVASGVGTVTSVLGSALTSALGGFAGSGGGEGVSAAAPVMRAASGAVLTTPTYFPTAGGLGLAGEAGAEAILPLERGGDGRLGVRASAGTRPVAVTVNVATPDLDGFRRSEAQVSAAIARAVARGQRAL